MEMGNFEKRTLDDVILPAKSIRDMPAAWSACLLCGQRVCCAVCVSAVWSACLLCGLRVCCVVCCVVCIRACCVAWCDGLMQWCSRY